MRFGRVLFQGAAARCPWPCALWSLRAAVAARCRCRVLLVPTLFVLAISAYAGLIFLLAVDTLPAHRHALMRYWNVLLKS